MLVVKINHLTIVWFKARSPFVLKHTTSYTYNIYPILHYPPLILSRSLRSLADKQTSPIFNCVTPVSVSLADNIYPILHYPPLILSRSRFARSPINKHPRFSIVLPLYVSRSLRSLANKKSTNIHFCFSYCTILLGMLCA